MKSELVETFQLITENLPKNFRNVFQKSDNWSILVASVKLTASQKEP